MAWSSRNRYLLVDFTKLPQVYVWFWVLRFRNLRRVWGLNPVYTNTQSGAHNLHNIHWISLEWFWDHCCLHLTMSWYWDRSCCSHYCRMTTGQWRHCDGPRCPHYCSTVLRCDQGPCAATATDMLHHHCPPSPHTPSHLVTLTRGSCSRHCKRLSVVHNPRPI